MQFRLPIAWLADAIRVPESPAVLAALLSRHGPSVERVIATRYEFSKVVVAQILALERHPEADRLQVATVTIGKKKTLQVVCGAPNIAVGQKVPLAMLGARLPSMVIERRAVRGVVSEGMLCSARELGIHDDQVGILILDNTATVGASLSSLGIASDSILEVEPTTNRPDIASVLGVARELSAITGRGLTWRSPKPLRTGRGRVNVRILDRKGCQRFMAVEIAVSVGPSPWWLQERLARSGVRPINNVVDVTNYVMLELGHPLHVFDADVVGQTLVVRRARAKETLLALDGKTYTLTPDDMVVANEQQVLSLAGIMGGSESGVTSKTKRVILEAATWEPVVIRRTSRRHQVSSEAQKLFEKGLSTQAPPIAFARAAELISTLASGVVSLPAFDWGTLYRPRVLRLTPAAITRLLGIDLSAATIAYYLKRLGFIVRATSATLTITVPYWRDNDVTSSEDITEEVARLYGYDRFESSLPVADVAARASGAEFRREHALKALLAAWGYTETYSYSLVSETLLSASGHLKEAALVVANPLNTDLVYLRPSLLPSLIESIARNAAVGHSLRLFEMAKVYGVGNGAASLDGYRHEAQRVAAVCSDSLSVADAFREAKGILEALAADAGIGAVAWQDGAPLPFVAARSTTLLVDGVVIGYAGIIDPALAQRLGVSATLSAVDADAAVLSARTVRHSYVPVPKFPSVKRDISLVVPKNVRYTAVVAGLRAASSLLETVELFDTYDGAQVGEDKISYSVHVTFRSAEKTLTSDEVAAAELAMMSAMKHLKVVIRS